MAKTIKHQDENDETTPAMFGGIDHLDIAQNKTFTAVIFESLTEKAPTLGEVKLLDLILNLSFDHGPNSPSATKTIEETKNGEGMGKAVGMGISQINERHGGAGEPLMEALYKIENGELTIESYVETSLAEGKRIPGMGHRVYKDKDPRAQLILQTAKEQGVGVKFVELVNQIRDELEKQSGKSLPVNIDGAIAAVLCGFGLNPKVGIAVFIIARTVGLSGHYVNNRTNLKI